MHNCAQDRVISAVLVGQRVFVHTCISLEQLHRGPAQNRLPALKTMRLAAQHSKRLGPAFKALLLHYGQQCKMLQLNGRVGGGPRFVAQLHPVVLYPRYWR